MDGEKLKDNIVVYQAYLQSKHFDVGKASFLPRLSGTGPELDQVLLGLIESMVLRAGIDNPKPGEHNLYHVWEPLLRVYSSHKHEPQILARCLDVIDALYLLGALGDEKLNNVAA